MTQEPVVLVTSLLGGGGAERVVATMANWWAAQGQPVAVVVMRARTAQDYPLDPRVRVVELNVIGETNPWYRVAGARGLWVLRRTLVGLAPRVVIAFQDKLNVAVLLALRGTGIRVVVTEHVVPWLTPLGRVWETLRRWAYPWAERVVAPTEGIAQWFRERGHRNVGVQVYPASIRTPSEVAVLQRDKTILGAGRLVPVKGFEMLIEAFASIASELTDWSLVIAGEGPERARLEALISAHNLSGRVNLPGHLPELYAEMERASIFALSSHAEAFPMVLIEAMSAGCAVIATDCPTGPREILGDGVHLTPVSPAALAHGLVKLCSDAVLRDAWALEARNRAVKFSVGAVMPSWDHLVRTMP